MQKKSRNAAMQSSEIHGSRSQREGQVSDGDALALVALHYGLIDDVYSSKMKVVCPLHDDLRPSMLLDLENGMWYCFGCEQSGHAQKLCTLIEKHLSNANDLQALLKYNKIIAGAERVKLPKLQVTRRTKADDRQLYAIAYDYYHGLKTIDWLCPEFDEARDVLSYMRERGFDAETLNRACAKVTFNRNYELIFPMLDNGKFKGWVSRTTVPEIEAERKYLYNKGFSRATTLVGCYGDSKYVIVVEGYMDRLKLLQLGLQNVVAILGWKMSKEQIQKLKSKGVEYVVAATDNDDAGRKGAAWLKQNFKTIRWPYLKGVKDPGDFDEVSFARMLARLKLRMEKEKWDL